MGAGLSEVQRENRVSLEGALQSIDEFFFFFSNYGCLSFI